MEGYAEAIELLSITDGDPEIYFQNFEKSLSPLHNLEAESVKSVSSTNCKCKLFNPGFCEFIADIFRGLLCLIVFPCCTLNECLEHGPQSGTQSEQPSKREPKSK